MTVTVACVKSKPAYDHHWVNRLYRAVQKHLSVQHRFVCFTDDSSGIACQTKPLPKGLRGWNAKMALHRPVALSGKVLYLDLDTLIVDSLDFVAKYEGDFAILRDFYRADGYGSGVMLWNKPQPQVWTRWLELGMPEHPLGDQGWMEEFVPNADRLQDVFPGKFVSFKVHCESGELPKESAVLSFHGAPKNCDFPREHWVTRLWLGEAA